MEEKNKSNGLNGLLGARVISITPPKCETCRNDAAGTNCVKVYLAGKATVCMAKK